MYPRLVRWAFDRFYREFAWTYDTVAALVSGGQWQQWALATLPLLRGRVLELGCGPGHLQCALAGRPGGPGVGLDLSAQMLWQARRRVAQAGHSALLVRGAAQALPFAPASFDTVVATFPTDYIAAPATLHEARRVLCADGRLVVALGAQLDGHGLYRQAVDLAYRLTLQRPPTRDTAARPTSGARLIETLQQVGFAASDLWAAAPGGSVYLITASLADATNRH